MKKNLLIAALLMFAVFLMTGCNSGFGKEADKTPLTATEIKQMYSDPDAFKGRYIEISGRVFGNVQKDSVGVNFQMWQNPSDRSGNTLVSMDDPYLDVSENDFVIVKGTVKGIYKKENGFSGGGPGVIIHAEFVEVSDQQIPVVPATKLVKKIK